MLFATQTQLAVLAIASSVSAAVLPRTALCGPNVDAVTCATNAAQSFVVKPTATIGNYTVTIPVSYGRTGPQSSVSALVNLALTNCQLSAPVVSKGPGFTCMGAQCENKMFTYTVKNSTTEASRQLLSATTDGKILFNQDTASNPVDAWLSPSVTSTSSTVNQSFNLGWQQTCVPTNIQYSVTCQAKLTSYNTAWSSPYSPVGIQCGNTQGSFPWNFNPELQDFCASVDPNYSFSMTMDLKQPTGGDPWSLQGCSQS